MRAFRQSVGRSIRQSGGRADSPAVVQEIGRAAGWAVVQ